MNTLPDALVRAGEPCSHPTPPLPHLKLDNIALNSHNIPERKREYVEFKALIRSERSQLWPRLSELTSAPPTPAWPSWRAVSPRSYLMKKGDAPRLPSSASPKPASGWSDRWPGDRPSPIPRTRSL